MTSLTLLQCFIQLKRPSDGAVSEPLPFEYLPLDSGRRSIWALRKSLRGQGNMKELEHILSLNRKMLNLGNSREEQDFENSSEKNTSSLVAQVGSPTTTIQQDKSIDENNDETVLSDSLKASKIGDEVEVIDSQMKTTEWLNNTEFVPIGDDNNGTETVQNDTNGNGPVNLNSLGAMNISIDEDDKTATVKSDITDEDKTLNELLEQVAELDEIYSGFQVQRNDERTDVSNQNVNTYFDELFDDAATYTSLQRAFKNPLPIRDPSPPSPTQEQDEEHKYDDVEPLANPTAPIIDISPLKRESPVEEEKLPPLPPKRLRKLTAENTEYNAQINGKNADSDSLNESPPPPPERPVSQIIIKRTPDPNRSPAKSNSNSTTSSPQKKQGFFSRIFRRKSKGDASPNCPTDTKSSPADSREPSLNHFDMFDRNRLSTRSFRSPQSPSKKGKPVGRSVSSVSGKRPHLTADIVHIPLKGTSSDSLPMRSGSGNLMPEHYSSRVTLSNNLDRKTVSALQLADLPIQDGNMELIAIADAQSLKNLCEGQYGVHLDADVDLTEAEHFALYTSVAPHATQSEFDDMSALFAPVDATEVLPNSEIAKRLAAGGHVD